MKPPLQLDKNSSVTRIQIIPWVSEGGHPRPVQIWGLLWGWGSHASQRTDAMHQNVDEGALEKLFVSGGRAVL